MEIRQYVFERLNTGGEKLNPQEIRNCIYAGSFNDLIVRLARSDSFTQAWGIPKKEPDEPSRISHKLSQNRYYTTMADCQIVLRYFSLSEITKFRGSLKKTLDYYMIQSQNISLKACDRLESEYLGNIKTAIRIYGDHLFRLLNKAGELRRQRSIPLSDAVLLAIRNLGQKANLLPNHSETILEETKKLLTNDSTYRVLVSRGNTKREFEDRINLMIKTYQSVLER